jgi:hypothetical protein
MLNSLIKNSLIKAGPENGCKEEVYLEMQQQPVVKLWKTVSASKMT